MRNFLLIVCVALLNWPLATAAQPFSLAGKVINESSEPIGFASILIKNTKIGVATNSNGHFKITIIKLPATLVCKAVGFTTAEYIITLKDTFNTISIMLHPTEAKLEEVIVTGYATEKRRDVTGSVASIRDMTPGIAVDKKAYFTKSTYATGTVSRESESIILKGHYAADSSTVKPASGLLTAGELSDFKKWKLWNDYTKDEFKEWSQHWRITFRNRYCVQVQNGEHKPVINEKVWLVNNNTTDTVWQAITDNTGKAELWDNLDSGKNDQSTYTLYCGNQKLSNPVLFANGINGTVLNRPCSISNAVDIAFVVDATGSMGDEIRYLQTELNNIITRTAAAHKDITLRTGAVFYRDKGDEYLTRFSPLQTDATQLTDFISHQSANGGGDGPEAVEEALTTTLTSLRWNAEARTRIVFLVLDAPPHDGERERMSQLMHQAATMGIRIIPVVCSGADKSTEYLMRCLALATNGSYVFLTDDSGIGNAHIKPTTDEFKVELLNNLMVRLIDEMIFAPACTTLEIPTLAVNISVANPAIKVYPNPSIGRFTIEIPPSVKEFFITDFTGKMLQRINASDKKGQYTFDLGAYPTGTYLVKFYLEEKGWVNEKIVLMH